MTAEQPPARAGRRIPDCLEVIASIVIIVGGVSAVINNAARVFGWLP